MVQGQCALATHLNLNAYKALQNSTDTPNKREEKNLSYST